MEKLNKPRLAAAVEASGCLSRIIGAIQEVVNSVMASQVGKPCIQAHWAFGDTRHQKCV